MFDNFINGIKNGFKVANATRKLVFKDKQLFAFPVISAVISVIAVVIILAAGFAVYFAGNFQSLSNSANIALFIVFMIIVYFVVFLISTYFTMAMLIAFRAYSQGKKISIGAALGSTSPYMALIVQWSLFYTIIATIIRFVEGLISAALSRYGITGRIISSLLTGGINLTLAAITTFALPVILDEKTGPIQTIKESTSFIMKNFGDTFGGLFFAEIFEIALILIGFGLIFIGILPFILGSSASAGTATIIFTIAFVSLGFIVIIIGVLFRYVLFNCFKLIVYDYKTRKKLPKGFDAKLIEASIKKKRKSGGTGGLSAIGLGMGQQGGL